MEAGNEKSFGHDFDSDFRIELRHKDMGISSSARRKASKDGAAGTTPRYSPCWKRVRNAR